MVISYEYFYLFHKLKIMRITFSETQDFSRSISESPWEVTHRIAAFYAALADNNRTGINHTICTLDEFCMMDNIISGMRKMDGYDECRFTRNVFFYHTFRFLHQWLLRSDKARFCLMQGRILFDLMVPLAGQNYLEPAVFTELTNIFMVYLDGHYPKFFYDCSREEVESVAGALFKIIHQDGMESPIPCYAYFECIKKGISRPVNSYDMYVVVSKYLAQGWFDCVRRARSLMTHWTSIRARSIIEETAGIVSSWTLKKQVRAFLIATEFIREQERMEKGCVLLALYAGKTLSDANPHKARNSDEPTPKKMKFTRTNFIAKGSLISRLVVPFCSVGTKKELVLLERYRLD